MIKINEELTKKSKKDLAEIIIDDANGRVEVYQIDENIIENKKRYKQQKNEEVTNSAKKLNMYISPNRTIYSRL